MPIIRVTHQIITQKEREIHIAAEYRDIEVPIDFICQVETITGRKFEIDEDGVRHFPLEPGVINRIPHMRPGSAQLTTEEAEAAFSRQTELGRVHGSMTAKQRQHLLYDLIEGNA